MKIWFNSFFWCLSHSPWSQISMSQNFPGYYFHRKADCNPVSVFNILFLTVVELSSQDCSDFVWRPVCCCGIQCLGWKRWHERMFQTSFSVAVSHCQVVESMLGLQHKDDCRNEKGLFLRELKNLGSQLGREYSELYWLVPGHGNLVTMDFQTGHIVLTSSAKMDCPETFQISFESFWVQLVKWVAYLELLNIDQNEK